MLALQRSLLDRFPRNGPTDPIEYYRRPLVGWLFRERINLGLALLGDRRFDRALEIGYGAGALLQTVAPVVGELHGLDLDADPEPVTARLAESGITASLRRGSVYELPYETASFDLVISFSVFEHLHEYLRALTEVARVLRPDGRFLLGMPAVNRTMEVGFRAVGFKNIEHHHVTPPARVAACFDSAGLRVVDSSRLGLPGMRLYSNWLLAPR